MGSVGQKQDSLFKGIYMNRDEHHIDNIRKCAALLQGLFRVMLRGEA